MQIINLYRQLFQAFNEMKALCIPANIFLLDEWPIFYCLSVMHAVIARYRDHQLIAAHSLLI